MTGTLGRIERIQPQRFAPYVRYRDSGMDWLGQIPASWSSRRLRFLVETRIPKQELRALDPATEVSFVPMEAVHEYGGLDIDSTKPLSDVLDGYTYFRDGDVLVAKITPCFENGKGALAEGLASNVGLGTTELHVLRPSPEVEARFLLYLTLSQHFRRIGAASMYGAGGQKRVPGDFIRNFRHPLPSLSEQRTIADFLDRETAKIDALVAKKERLIELLHEKRAAFITRAVARGLETDAPMKDSGVEWLGEIPVHWNVWHLRRVVARFVDYRGRTPEKTPSGTPLVTAKNIKNLSIDFSQSEEFIPHDVYSHWMVRGLPERGDVLLTTEAPLGESAQVLDASIALAQRIILLKADTTKITNGYLKYHFAADSGRMELRTRATGSTALGIKASHLKASLVAVPPVPEQESIASAVDRGIGETDKLIAKIRQAIDHLNELRTALISAAVTGRIDVRQAAPLRDTEL